MYIKAVPFHGEYVLSVIYCMEKEDDCKGLKETKQAFCWFAGWR